MVEFNVTCVQNMLAASRHQVVTTCGKTKNSVRRKTKYILANIFMINII